jgi:hypothetical protein
MHLEKAVLQRADSAASSRGEATALKTRAKDRMSKPAEKRAADFEREDIFIGNSFQSFL